ncbi:MAG: cheB2 [Caulobacteraceae bacterium]|jgi:two-component system response regulator WspF|nr:cheB2 [Caulobacteraceae bacterium]
MRIEAAKAASRPPSRPPLVVIGASAGGPAALAVLLKGLPVGFPAAVVIVQHVDERFIEGLAQWLAEQSNLPVRLAREGERLEVGTVLLAGAGGHLTMRADGRLGYDHEPRAHAYCPSIDVFFHSVCERWSGRAVGVLLTGMGADGALGLKALRLKGNHTIAQDRATSAVYGMPKAAAAAEAAVDILPLDRIAARLARAFPVMATGDEA